MPSERNDDQHTISPVYSRWPLDVNQEKQRIHKKIAQVLRYRVPSIVEAKDRLINLGHLCSSRVIDWNHG